VLALRTGAAPLGRPCFRGRKRFRKLSG
jgi:hypothetical protein